MKRKLHLTILMLALLLTSCGRPAASPTLHPTPTFTPPASDQSYWPTEGWRISTPEEQGMDSELLAAAVDFLIQQSGYEVHSFLVIRHGYLVADAYFYPFTEGSLHDLASVTKSWTATLVGIAIERGYIPSVQQPILGFFPDRTVVNVDANKEAMTVEHLLTMRTGLACADESPEVTVIQMMSSPDWIQFALDLPMSEAPGTRWVYCSPGVHLLQAIIQQSSAMTALNFAQEYLFEPLGISDVVWPTDPQGLIHGWGNLRLTPHDMAKLGYLYLNGGQWDGAQLLPASWVQAATSAPEGAQPRDMNMGYGYLWWLLDGRYEAIGKGGQKTIVSPDKDIVVVLTAGGGRSYDTIQELLSSYVFPAAKSSSPLPPNSDAVALLRTKIQRAAEPPPVGPVPVPPPPAIAQRIAGQTYNLDANSFGFLTLSLAFVGQSEAILKITTDGAMAGDAEFEWLAGLDNVARIAPGRFGMPAAAKGIWDAENVFVAQVDEIGNNFIWRLSLTFQDDRVTVALQDMTGFFPKVIEINGHLGE